MEALISVDAERPPTSAHLVIAWIHWKGMSTVPAIGDRETAQPVTRRDSDGWIAGNSLPLDGIVAARRSCDLQ